MRVLVNTLAVCFVIAIGAVFAGWWVFSRQHIAIPPPTQLLKAQALHESKVITVPPGHVSSWTFTPPTGKTPGTLSGNWSSQGKSAGIKGATDDTLIAFTLTGPNDETLSQQKEHPLSGNFSVRCQSDGKYTFAFDNGGIIRSSARNVAIDATYQPD